MQKSDMQDRNIDWVIKTFRPLLKSLKVQHKENKPCYIETSQYRDLIIKGMGRCILSLRLSNRLKQDVKGFFIFFHNQRCNIFGLTIVLNNNLYEVDDLECRIERKAIAIHEFIHCVASMLSLSRLHKDSSILIASLKKQIDQKSTTISVRNKHLLFDTLYKTEETPSSNQLYERFDDSHYRLDFEDFTDDYTELYRTFLLSSEVINDLLKKDLKKELLSFLQENNIEGLTLFLNKVVNDIAFEKALKRDFVISRLKKIIASFDLRF